MGARTKCGHDEAGTGVGPAIHAFLREASILNWTGQFRPNNIRAWEGGSTS